MTESELKKIVLQTVIDWVQEEYDVNDDDWSWSDRFNHNLETFIELLQEEVL